jgi:adenylate kinase family enzyme
MQDAMHMRDRPSPAARMQRVMIIGQPGSGKSTFARRLGALTGLPVVHIDKIHWQPGWVERSRTEKDRLTREVHAREQWIFEGGHSRTWPDRLARADTLIWLDVPLPRRVWRVLRRTVTGLGRTRPDLPDDCPERLDRGFLEFLGYIWRTRASARAKIRAIFDAPPPHLALHRARTPAEARALLAALGRPAPPVETPGSSVPK